MDKELEKACNEFQTAIRRLSRLRSPESETPANVTPAEMQVIVSIYSGLKCLPEVRPSMIAAHSHSTKSALSQTLKSLESKNLILRTRSDEDSRAVALTLTEEGTQIAQEAEIKRKAQMEKLVEYLGADEIKSLIGTVNKILEFKESQGMVEVECCHAAEKECNSTTKAD